MSAHRKGQAWVRTGSDAGWSAALERAVAGGRTEQVLDVLDGWVRASPRSLVPRLVLADTLVVLGMDEVALAHLQRTLVLWREEPYVLRQLASLLRRMGRHADAEAAWRGHPPAPSLEQRCFWRGMARVRKGDLAGASHWLALLGDDSDEPWLAVTLSFEMARLVVRQGREAAAAPQRLAG